MKKYKFRLNNKAKILLGVITLLFCFVGGSFAWFTATGEVTRDFLIGSLKVTNTIQTPAENASYEPGETVEMDGVISNKGTIPSITRIYNVSQVKALYSDDNQTLISPSDRNFVQVPNGILNYKFGPTSNNYFDNSGAYWFQDPAGQTYLLLDPQTSVNVKVIATFNNSMSNQYQGATFKLGEKTRSTQVLDSSIKDVLGVSLDDLTPLDDTSSSISNNNINQSSMLKNNAITRSGHYSANAEKALNHLKNLANR